MKKIILSFCIFFSFIYSIAFSQNKQQTISQAKRDSIEIAFVKELNKYRKQHNLSELVINKSYTKVALEQAAYCASIDKLTHDIPSSNSLKARMSYYAENGTSSSFSVLSNIDQLSTFILNQWKTSKYHNEILLLNRTSIKGVGLSIEISKTNKVYYFLYIQF